MSWRDRLPRFLRGQDPPDPERLGWIGHFLELEFEDLTEDEWNLLVAEAESEAQRSGDANPPFPQLFYRPGEAETLIVTVPDTDAEADKALADRVPRLERFIARARNEDQELLVFRAPVKGKAGDAPI